LIPGKQKRSFNVTIANPNVGHHQSMLRTGVFLPLLPAAFMAGLAGSNMALAAVVSATVPALLILGIALLDARTRSALARLRTRLLTNFTD
ncbi:MAG: hypothetical protein JWN15_319, partial [Firmicutes bacterium]|nr:hypothetical protein [Bacillota bacterium]